MRKMCAIPAFIPAFLLVVLAAANDAAAENEVFRITSMSESKVQMQFFSMDRRVRWPSANRAFDLNDYNEHKFNLSCINGEKICYGAWVTGNSQRYWGVGAEGKARCDDCCYTCGGSDPRRIVLRSPIRR